MKRSVGSSAGNDFVKEAISMEKAFTVGEYQNV